MQIKFILLYSNQQGPIARIPYQMPVLRTFTQTIQYTSIQKMNSYDTDSELTTTLEVILLLLG